jgi:hypothetical protein
MAFPFLLTISIDSKDFLSELQDIFICEEERYYFSHLSGVSLTSTFYKTFLVALEKTKGRFVYSIGEPCGGHSYIFSMAR